MIHIECSCGAGFTTRRGGALGRMDARHFHDHHKCDGTPGSQFADTLLPSGYAPSATVSTAAE